MYQYMYDISADQKLVLFVLVSPQPSIERYESYKPELMITCCYSEYYFENVLKCWCIDAVL